MQLSPTERLEPQDLFKILRFLLAFRFCDLMWNEFSTWILLRNKSNLGGSRCWSHVQHQAADHERRKHAYGINVRLNISKTYEILQFSLLNDKNIEATTG